MGKVVAIKFHPAGVGANGVLLLFKNPPTAEEVLAELKGNGREVEAARRSITMYGWKQPTVEQMRREGAVLWAWRHTEDEIPAGWTKAQLIDVVYNDRPVERQPWRLFKTHK